MVKVFNFFLCSSQAKKKYYDTELETLEKHQKQTIEKMETDHTVRLRDETKRIRAEQERDYNKFQEQMKHKKKEVRGGSERKYACVCVHVLLYLNQLKFREVRISLVRKAFSGLWVGINCCSSKSPHMYV